MLFDLFFHRENWLGGYASFKRRMYRLAHISCFGLGAVNLLFCLTVRAFSLSGPGMHLASMAFITGAIAMPVCCVVMAHFPKAQMIFAVPVVSLMLGGSLTLAQLLKEPNATGAANPPTQTSNLKPSTPN